MQGVFFALSELNGCRILRLPIPADSKLSGAFIFQSLYHPREKFAQTFAAQFGEFFKRDPDSREREIFGARAGERASAGRAIYSDRYKLLQLDAARRKRQIPNGGKR
jgi:hypothetical protein